MSRHPINTTQNPAYVDIPDSTSIVAPDGQNVTVQAGNAVSGSGNNGANVDIEAGAGDGHGSNGTITIGTTSGNVNIAGNIRVFGPTLLGMFGTSPAPQPVNNGLTGGYTGGAGGAVLAGSTFTGGSGIRAYTIGDIVAALKALGLIAT